MSTGAAPARGVAPRWGIGDAVVVWVLGLMAGALAQAPFVEGKCIPQTDEDVATFVSLVLQTTATVLILFSIARSRGRGSLKKDFGFVVRLKDAPFLLAGLGVALLSTGILEPITNLGDIDKSSQDVKRIFDQSTGVGLGLLIVAVLVLAPMGEELLFRGVLLRSLQRRVTSWQAIFLAALGFAFVHVALDFGAGFGVPALLLLGLVSGWRAVQTRDLSQSIWLHAGFNLLAVVGRIFDETLKIRSRCGR
jgi:membrane protease YdiL (CAAX protease family)